MSWLYRLERKFGRFAIQNLMFFIVIAQFAVFAADLILPDLHVSGWMYLDRALVLQGQIWRLITFIFLPPTSSVLWIILSLYFYYMIGGALENEWGAFKFNIYYLIGMIGTIIGAMITGYGANAYLNLSMFFAFAILWPNYELLIFWVIPVKIKYLAVVDGVFFVISAVSALAAREWGTVASIVASLLNVLLFFGGDVIRSIKRERGYAQTRKNWRSQMNDWERNQRKMR